MAWPFDYGAVNLGQPMVAPDGLPPEKYREPQQITAGNSITWTRWLPDYLPANGWGLTYCIVSSEGGTVNSFSSTPSADGKNHDVSASPAVTTGFVTGQNKLTGFAIQTVNGSVAARQTIFDGYVEVLPDLQAEAAAGQALDMRSHNRRMWDNLKAVMEGRASHDVLNSQIEGTMIGRIPPLELMRLEGVYRARVKAEDESANVAAGRATGRIHLNRFRRC